MTFRTTTTILSGILLALLASSDNGWSTALVCGADVDCVNPLSGANGDYEFSRGNTVVAIVAPFGMTTPQRQNLHQDMADP
jgi:hypothetical protein